MTRTASRCLSLFLVIMGASGFSVGKVTTGTPPFGSFGGGPFDTVNLASLNVHFEVPVIHKAGRGTPFSYDLSYDSLVWKPVGVSGSQTWQPASNWGWQARWVGAVGYVSALFSSQLCSDLNGNYGTNYIYSNFVY